MTSKRNKPTVSGPNQPGQPPRTAEDLARYKAIRERFQQEKPSLEELVSSGEYNESLPMGEHLSIRQAVFALKKAREAAGLSLAGMAERTGIDKAALSRIETGQHPNPTVSTLCRYAHALGKRWKWVLENEATPEGEAATGGRRQWEQGMAKQKDTSDQTGGSPDNDLPLREAVCVRDLLVFAQTLERAELRTLDRERPFTLLKVNIQEQSMTFMTSKGNEQLASERWLQRTCEIFSQTHSYRPRDYGHTHGASYTLAVIKRFVECQQANA